MQGGRGNLVLVVGPSGAGKDALLAAARQRFAGDPKLCFAERIVTRPNRAGHVTHVEMSWLDFELAVENGRFGLHWYAHGNRYGVPVDALAPLAAGRAVVVNASRTVIEEARVRYAPVRVVLVTASTATREARMRQRGRERGSDISARLERGPALTPTGPDVIELDNEGPLSEAALRFSNLLADLAPR